MKNNKNDILKKLPTDETIYDLAELFKVFGDSTRTKILYTLAINDLTVGEISKATNMTQSAVSHQLRVLKNSKLVKGIKEKKTVKYSLDDNHVMLILNCGLEHLKER